MYKLALRRLLGIHCRARFRAHLKLQLLFCLVSEPEPRSRHRPVRLVLCLPKMHQVASVLKKQKKKQKKKEFNVDEQNN